jgi:hypothetical protein
MSNNGQEWLAKYPPVDEATINRVAEILGVTFPASFVEIAKLYHGGEPLKDSFHVNYPRIGQIEGCISTLLSFAADNPYPHSNMLYINQNPPDCFPEGLVMFGEDAGGNYMCFDFRANRSTPEPPIVYWSHESREGEDIFYLAATFTDFLNMLHESEF